MNVLMIATVSMECKNLFAYSENNHITGKDSSGGIVKTIFDLVTLAGSIVDVCCNPTDPWAWAGLAGDVVDLIPIVTGVGEGIKGARAVVKIADTVDDIRIRAEQHPLLPGETYNPRHHGVHYHVEYKVDPTKSWNNKNNVKKWYPEGYTHGAGSGFIPGEPFPE